MTEPIKEYIGDAVYAELNDYGDIVLTTEDGIRVTNRIVLEPQVMKGFIDFLPWALEQQSRRNEKPTVDPG